MNFWEIIWKVIFILGVLAFAGMAVWVTIGGYFDIKRLFARINESHEKNKE